MQIVHPSPSQAKLCLRALKSVLISDGVIGPGEERMLAAGQRYITRTAFDVSSLQPIEPSELAPALAQGPLREQLIGAMVVNSFAGGEASGTQLQAIQAFADALHVQLAEIETLRHYVHRSYSLMRFDVIRRMYIGDALADIWKTDGVKGILQTIGGLAGLRQDLNVANKYIAMGDLPAGTLGRALFDHYRDNGFAFPGEKHGGPEVIILHDAAHVLGGYATDPDGEFQVAGFTAGFRRQQSWSILIFVLCQFDLGVRIAPAPGATAQVGLLDPDRMLAAVVRGSRMTVDLFDDWDFWAATGRQLEELRVEYGIEQRQAPGL